MFRRGLFSVQSAYRCKIWSSSTSSQVYFRAMATAKIVPNKSDGGSASEGEPTTFPTASDCILYLDSNYCVVDKPHKVRMTGDFIVTVEKLLLHWIPGIQIDSLKYIHQLDFATSGVLTVGLNRKAAAVASASFEARTVKKQYLAVLQGHVDINEWPVVDSRPAFPEEEDEGDDVSLPGKRKLSKLDTSNINVSNAVDPKRPASPIATWQEEVKDANLAIYFDAFTAWKAAHCDPSSATNTSSAPTYNAFKMQHPDKWKAAAPLVELSFEALQKYAKQRKALRKFLKSCGVQVEAQASELSARPDLVAQQAQFKEELAHNTVTDFEVTLETVQALSSAHKSPPALPRIYRLRGAENRLVINVPVAEILGDFRMEPGHEGNPGKHCETEMEVLEQGFYNGMTVTKVRYYPRTGRRHQLRVHSMSLGHPIVGDYTYNPQHRDAVQAEARADSAISENSAENSAFRSIARETNEEGSAGRFYVADRMMLHAQRLRVNYPPRKDLKLPDAATNSETNELIRPVLQSLSLPPTGSNARDLVDNLVPIVEVEARDPFVFVHAELQV